MNAALTCATACMLLGPAYAAAAPDGPDPRLREVSYDPRAVVSVPVKRGVVTLIVLGPDEAIAEVAAGLGGECTKLESAWCIAAQPNGRTLFIKPKSTASAVNNLAVVTNRRVHNFRLLLLAEHDPRPATYRLVVRAPSISVNTSSSLSRAPQHLSHPNAQVLPVSQAATSLPQWPLPSSPSAAQLVFERLQAKPLVKNTQYSLAEGSDARDIVPSLVFDDGRFTYLRFAGNREVPAVFQVLGDGRESLVNARMEGDLLVVDRVSRRLTLRAGSSVVGIWNDAFSPDGLAPRLGTTVPGVERVLKADSTALQPRAAGATP